VNTEAQLPLTNGKLNGTINGYAAKSTMSDRARRKVKDAQEFELDALISEDDEEGGEKGRRKEEARGRGRDGAVRL